MSILIGQKSTNQIAQYLVQSWCGFRMLLLMLGTLGRPSGDFRRVFTHCQRLLNVSRFLYSGGWKVCILSPYSYFEKGCGIKCTRQPRKVLWLVLSALFFKEI